MSAGKLKPNTAKRIVETRKRFVDADKAIYGASVFGPDQEVAAVETLVERRHDYQEALDQGERELGLK